MGKARIYYFIDISLQTKQILNYGETNSASHHGNTEDASVHRMCVPKGQYNKLVKKLAEFER